MVTHGRRPLAAGLLVAAVAAALAACGGDDEVSFDSAGGQRVDSGDDGSSASASASASASDGRVVEITADRQFECNGEDIDVQQTDVEVFLSGSCGVVAVSGTDNDVAVGGSADEVVISGSNNDVGVNSAGQVTVSGVDNDYCVRNGSVNVTGSENKQRDCSDLGL